MPSKKALVVFFASRNLYGTTQDGGLYGFATVFELIPGSGAWTEKVIHNFNNDGQEGFYPQGGLTLDNAGNQYGTTSHGGANSCGGAVNCGTVLELICGNSGWTEKVPHNFEENGKDGYSPAGGVTLDAPYNMYGATESGGADCLGCGGFGCGPDFVLTHNDGSGWKRFCTVSPTPRMDPFPWQPILVIVNEPGRDLGDLRSRLDVR
jgi:hypothetical protein